MQTPTLEDTESSLPAQKFTAPCVAPDFAQGEGLRMETTQDPAILFADHDETPEIWGVCILMLPGDRCMLNWFLEFAEALLGEALAMIAMSPSHV